jgi:undecaprenyl-diphosphatase
MDFIQAIIIAIVEGLTEFLPISSTGHMIITSSLLGVKENNFRSLFEVCIQLGAIMAVVIVYWKKFVNLKDINFYLKLIIAFIPTAIIGLLFHSKIKELMNSNLVVGISLLVGGIVLIFIDNFFKENTTKTESEITYLQALKAGCFQVISMVPGVSRSASTIIGGMTTGMTRSLAAEFSFFLAVPTMFAASAKDLLEYFKAGNTLSTNEIGLLATGNVVAFIVALLAIKFFIAYLSKNGFKLFGWYRIIVGLIIIAFYTIIK